MHPMRFLIIVLLLGFFGVLTMLMYQSIMDISMSQTAMTPAGNSTTTPPAADTVYVGVISRFSPNLIYEGYQPIIDYLSRETPFRFVLRLSNSYEQTISQLEEDKIQMAFLGTFLYLQARKNHAITCILKPLNSQFEPHFHSVVVTRSDSPMRSISDLKGKRLALPSPLSFSGNWVLHYEFKKYDLNISDLDSVRYFDFHHTVIYQVLRGNFDAGVVKDRVADEFASKGIRILATSEPIPGSPLIIKNNLDSAIIRSIKEALLKIDIKKPAYRDLVQAWDPEFAYGFAEANSSDYDSVEVKMGSLTGRL